MYSTDIPPLGFGTYGRRDEEGIAAILAAIETGYRHIDTAQDYDTEKEVGEAIRRSGIPREEFFVTTKIAARNFAQGRLIPSLEESIANCGFERFDLTLIHWPSPHDEVPLETYLTQLAEAQERGLTRLIGVSNFTIALINESERILGAGKLATNQVELNPYMQNRTLAKHCMDKGITITCYQPISKGRLASDPVLKDIAARHGATVEQVALAWEMAKGYCAIPTSGNAGRIRTNYGALEVELTPEDVTAIEALDRKQRHIDPDWGPEWDD